MPRKYRKYTDEDLINYAKEVFSLAGLLKKIDLKPCGGNYINLKKNLQKLNINTDHWTKQGWSKDQQLKDWSQYTKSHGLKKHLIKLKGHKCEQCLNSKWQKQIISLEVHHIDGDRTNNSLENLKLLCCNCHSLTKNWRNRK